MVHTETY